MTRRRWLARLGLGAALLLPACGKHDHDHGSDHGHAHGPAGDHPEEGEEPSLAITRWTPRYELFVELPAPAPGKPVSYHAHVTELASFGAVTIGTFKVRYKTSSGVTQEHVQEGVKRPGIFVFEGPAPAAGDYALEMEYAHDGKADVFDCGTITIADPPVAPAEEEPAAAITFLKESQWKIPFGTDWVEQHPLAREIELTATLEPAASAQLTVSAPTTGRFFHNQELALAEGLRIEQGSVLGTITPTVAGDDYTRLQAAVDEARLAREQMQREIARVEPLVKQGLLPERRLLQLQNELESETRRLGSAGARLRSVEAPSGRDGLTIRSGLSGLVSQVLVPNGEPVQAGAPLVRIAGTEQLWIRARFVARPALDLTGAAPTAVRLASGEQIALEPLGARFLSSLPTIDPRSQLATWLVETQRGAGSASMPASLRAGMNVVLTVRFGAPEVLLAMPRSAVSEINTRPYGFVQLDGEHFERRALTLGRTDGPWVEIANGLARGERVVTRGGYDIHLASLMGTVESHRH